MSRRRRRAQSPSQPRPIRSYPVGLAERFRRLGQPAGALWRWNVAHPMRAALEWRALLANLERLGAITPYRWEGDLLVIDTPGGPVAVAHYSEFPRRAALDP